MGGFCGVFCCCCFWFISFAFVGLFSNTSREKCQLEDSFFLKSMMSQTLAAILKGGDNRKDEVERI